MLRVQTISVAVHEVVVSSNFGASGQLANYTASESLAIRATANNICSYNTKTTRNLTLKFSSDHVCA